MGPYDIPGSPADGKPENGGTAQYTCSWYAPGAAGGVNIDGGTAADPETGMVYVGSQSGLGTIAEARNPCSEHRYSQPHNSCVLPFGHIPPTVPGYVAPAGGEGGGRGGRGGGGGGRGGAGCGAGGVGTAIGARRQTSAIPKP